MAHVAKKIPCLPSGFELCTGGRVVVVVVAVEVLVVFKYLLLQQTDPSSPKPCFGTKHFSATNCSEKNQFIEFKFAKRNWTSIG